MSTKREDPCTPHVRQGKKMKEYGSPFTTKTPLKNVAATSVPSPLSKAIVASKNDDLKEKKQNKAIMLRKKKQVKTAILSPAVVASPKAVAPASIAASPRPIISTPRSNLRLLSNAEIPKLTVEQMNKKFEEWVRIAADNKINSKNTWNLALIDYFSELTFLKEGDSINFQKASCTLDGCVKIYSSRVDSVMSETEKLLNGFTEATAAKDTVGSKEGNDNKEEEEGNSPKKQAKKRVARNAETLEKAMESLNLKHVEMALAIDPLFKKTCAEFDESKSHGSLLKSLIFSGDGRILFDSLQPESVNMPHEDSIIDISKLKKNFGLSLASCKDRVISQTFKDFCLDSGTETKGSSLILEKLNAINSIDTINDATNCMMDESVLNFDDESYDYHNDQAVQEEFADSSSEKVESKDQAIMEQNKGFGLIASMRDNNLAFFDQKANEVWAGPEHWKIRRPRTAQVSVNPAVKKSAAVKKDFVIDFYSQEVDLAALYAKAQNSAAITLSKLSLQERSLNNNMLPEDLGYSSAEFLRLFTKPNFRFGTLAATIKIDQPEQELLDRCIAKETKEQPMMPGEHYDNDIGGFSDDGDEMQETPTNYNGSDSSYMVAAKSIQPIKFARVAKKVDLRKLKDAIWSEIEHDASKSKSTTFTKIISEIEPKGDLKDVSVPYCFICLLHLANEHGLELQVQERDVLIGL